MAIVKVHIKIALKIIVIKSKWGDRNSKEQSRHENPISYLVKTKYFYNFRWHCTLLSRVASKRLTKKPFLQLNKPWIIIRAYIWEIPSLRKKLLMNYFIVRSSIVKEISHPISWN